MKRITGIAVVVTAFIGCSYVGSAGAKDGDYTASTTCQQVWELSPQASDASFIEVSKIRPDVTEDVKQTSINVCESAKRVGKLGGTVEQVLSVINERMRGMPEDQTRSVAFMAVSGWKIGEMGR